MALQIDHSWDFDYMGVSIFQIFHFLGLVFELWVSDWLKGIWYGGGYDFLQEFDGVYGPAWHCIVGTSFGSFVTHSVGGFMYFAMDHKLYILLFKTAVQRADWGGQLGSWISQLSGIEKFWKPRAKQALVLSPLQLVHGFSQECIEDFSLSIVLLSSKETFLSCILSGFRYII